MKKSRSGRLGGNRACLCKDGTYSRKCCDGGLWAQGIGNIYAEVPNGANKYVVQHCENSKQHHVSIEGYFADRYEMGKRNDAKEEIIEALRDLLEVKAESYSDYPQGVSNNAKRGIELNKKVNNKCATQVGKVRAQQLANREPVSVATIKRMYSYLSRAETYYEQGDQNDCG